MPIRRALVTSLLLVSTLHALTAGATSVLATSVGSAQRIREHPDRTWMVDGKVFALVRSGGVLYLGGRFTQLLPPRGSDASAIPASNLAAIDLSSGEPIAGWRPQVRGPDAVVHALAVTGDRVVVGGSFDSLAGSPAANLGAVTALGGDRISGFAPQVAGRVYALEATTELLYAGGAFGKVDARSRSKLAAWSLPTWELSRDWRPRAVGGAVRDLEPAPRGRALFVAGAFSQMAQEGSTFWRESVAKVDAGDGSLARWHTEPGRIGVPQTAWSVEARRRRVHGGFGRGPNFAASFVGVGDEGTRIWRYALPGNVQTVELSPDGSRLFLGGHFGLGARDGRACGEDLRGLVSVDPATGEPFCDWIPQLAPFVDNFDGPWTMLAVGDELWVGGGWGTIDGVQQRGLARFDIG